MNGWMGTILRIDLTTGEICKECLELSVARDYIGGRGFNSRALFKEIKPGIDPLGPENRIYFGTGPLTATGLCSSSRLSVSTLSPNTNILRDGNVGGRFATIMKRAGYDQIIIAGRAKKPVYLWIDDDIVELIDAQDLAGLSTWETCDILYNRHGRETSVASIGQAGENLVRFATTIVDKHNSAARGSGAVLGSKNLKAIAIHGSKHVTVANKEIFKELVDTDRQFFLNDTFQQEVIAVYGSHIGISRWSPGFRNYEKFLRPEEVPDALTAEGMKKFEVKRTACYGCVVPCKDVFRIPEGKYAGEIGKALEHECTFCLGTNCGITNPVPIMVMGNLADKYGMCVLALGNVIAMIKDLFQNETITKRDTGGLSLSWDDEESQIELVHQVALRQGFGNIVAEGMYNTAKLIGRGAINYCYHVKGLSRGPHPAGIFGLAHATSTRGADHLRGRSWAFGENDPDIWPELIEKGFIPEDDPVTTLKISERAVTLTDMIGRCKGAVNNWASAVPLVFKYPLLEGVARLLTAATGIEFTERSVSKASDRVYLLEMAFNARQGITRKHDRLPLKPDLAKTPKAAYELAKHNKMLDQYYRLRGCDIKTGIPSNEVLKSLGLGFAADELDNMEREIDWDGPPLWPAEIYPSGGNRA